MKQRDTGVAWLGAIPAHWGVSRMKFVATVQTGIALGKDFGGHALREYPYLRVANVQDGFIDISDVKTMLVPEREAAGALLRKGDVLMNEGGDADKLGRGAVWDGAIAPCLHQNHVFALRPTGVSSAWLSAWTGSDYAKAYFETRAKQSTNLASLSSTNLLELPIAVPPADEQQAIVARIAQKTAHIDALLAAKQRLLDLLAEKHKAIIATAVTRGLDLKAKLRGSGGPWLDELPAHWKVIPLRYLLSHGPKNGVSPPQSGSEGVLSFSISAVRDGRVTIHGNEKYVALERSAASDYYIKAGDILLVRGNGNLSLVGTCGLVDMAPDECSYPDILMLMRVGEQIFPELLVAAINSNYVRCQIESLAQTTNGTFKLSGEDVRTLRIAVPPLNEQHAIVAHITRETARLDAIRAATERTIALLRERRAALIAAAVTGQLDLSGHARNAAAIQAPEPQEACA